MTNRGFEMWEYQNKLVLIFKSTAVVNDLSPITLRQVVRWVVYLSVYNYMYINMPSTTNEWEVTSVAELLPVSSNVWDQWQFCYWGQKMTLPGQFMTKSGYQICFTRFLT